MGRKTTLLKLMVGDEPLSSGRIEVAPGVVIGYFHQDHRTLDFTLDPVKQTAVATRHGVW